MARVRYIDKPEVEGSAGKWNPCGLGECILWFDDGSATSEEVKLLEPIGMTRQEWYDEMTAREP
ncbi:hypothetical protein KGP36_06950 [Patescibacteria group bacterium]|nr:hypothetical protein [Patescibacteria group bacterium]